MISPVSSKVIGHPFLHARVHSLDQLECYTPSQYDVKFNFGLNLNFSYNYNIEIMINFEKYWRLNGMIDIFEVVDVVRDPISDDNPPYIQNKFLIARFENAESALLFRLTIS